MVEAGYKNLIELQMAINHLNNEINKLNNKIISEDTEVKFCYIQKVKQIL